MTSDNANVQIAPLVPNIPMPYIAGPRTRAIVPSGYGVQEQCLPFTAASGLGFLIPSPIRFGHCPMNEVPKGCLVFRSPFPVDGLQREWVFYVQDDPSARFSGNAYNITDLPQTGAFAEPGISFFDREDQQDLFKLHLPYIWRTSSNVDTLFLPLINRSAKGLEVQSGLVETDWYATPINLVLRKSKSAIHFLQNQEIAQAILIVREHRKPQIEVVAGHSRVSRECFKALLDWYDKHARDRSAYKILARSQEGRIE